MLSLVDVCTCMYMYSARVPMVIATSASGHSRQVVNKVPSCMCLPNWQLAPAVQHSNAIYYVLYIPVLNLHLRLLHTCVHHVYTGCHICTCTCTHMYRYSVHVAVYKGLFLELPSGRVIIITVYTFPSVYYSAISSLLHLVLT